MAFHAELPRSLQERMVNPFVGRERELEALGHAFQRAIDGRGGLVLVSGEAGIGKTSLVQAFIDDLEQRAGLILRGYCYDLSTTPPYGLWLELTDRYPERPDLPELPEVLKRGTGVGDLPNQLALFEVAHDFLTALAGEQPLVVLLEDLHWADQASLDLLRYLARQVQDERILLIGTYRDDEVARGDILFSLLPTLLRESQAIRLELNLLGSETVSELVRERWTLPNPDQERLVSYLLRNAEGHPLFMVELVRTLEQGGFIVQTGDQWRVDELRNVPVPRLVRQVIEARVAHLGAEARHYLEVAAVIGHRVPLKAWQAVTGMSDEDLLGVLDEAIKQHLLEEVSDQNADVQFVHALTREALYAEILPPRRQIWHRLIADILVDTHNPDPDAIAHHLQQASDPRAVEWLIRSGERAQQTFAWRSAVDRYRAASGLLEGVEDRQREYGWLRYRTARLGLYLDPAEAIVDLDEAYRIGIQSCDEVLRIASLIRRGHFRTFTGDILRSVQEMSQGVAEWEELPTEEKLACEYISIVGADPYVNDFRGTYLVMASLSGRFRECLQLAETFFSELEPAKERLLAARHIYYVDGYVGAGLACAAVGETQRARELLEEARQGFATISIPIMESYSIHSILSNVHVPYQTDRVDERVRLTREMDDAWQRSSGGIRPEMQARLQHCKLLALEGHWDEVLDLAHRGLNWHANKSRQIEVRTPAGIVAWHQGNLDLAWEQVNSIFIEGPATEPGSVGSFNDAVELISLAVQLELDKGNLERAHSWLVARDGWMEWSGALVGQAEGLLLWARYSLISGDRRLAREYAEEALRLASEPRQPVALISAYRFLGELALLEDRLEEAENSLAAALELATACAAPYDRALSLIALAELDLLRNETPNGRVLLSEARQICTKLHARPALDRIGELETKLTPQNPELRFGLTHREIDVLRLLVLGMSDREIGANLFISHHTVMRHVSNILRKLDVESRTAAATEALRCGLV